MKKAIIILAALVCILAVPAGAYTAAGAAAPAGDEATVVFNGKVLEFDVAPRLINDRVMVPLRAIFEKCGAVVEWDGETQTATGTKGDDVVVITIGDPKPTVNGEVVEIDQPAVLVFWRTLAPLRFVAEAFGGTVKWEDETNTAFITFGEGEEGVMADTKLLYQGHGSFRITAADGTVVYVDPFAGEGYDVPADIILVTHQHSDHNQLDLVTKKPDCTVIQNMEALKDGVYQSFDVRGIKIEALQAYNTNHKITECVSFLITVDGVRVYASGDTSKTAQMEAGALKKKKADYALLCGDGVYNMDIAEAAECAKLIGAKYNIPIHLKPGELFDADLAAKFDAPGKLVVAAGEEITLKK